MSGNILTKDSLIIVFYINVSDVDPQEMPVYMTDIKANFAKDKADDVVEIFIPINNGDSRVECINPKAASDDDMQRINTLINELNNKILIG